MSRHQWEEDVCRRCGMRRLRGEPGHRAYLEAGAPPNADPLERAGRCMTAPELHRLPNDGRERLRVQAAAALDGTVAVDGRGPRTFAARRRLAGFADSGVSYTGMLIDLRWLEALAAGVARGQDPAQIRTPSRRPRLNAPPSDRP